MPRCRSSSVMVPESWSVRCSSAVSREKMGKPALDEWGYVNFNDRRFKQFETIFESPLWSRVQLRARSNCVREVRSEMHHREERSVSSGEDRTSSWRWRNCERRWIDCSGTVTSNRFSFCNEGAPKILRSKFPYFSEICSRYGKNESICSAVALTSHRVPLRMRREVRWLERLCSTGSSIDWVRLQSTLWFGVVTLKEKKKKKTFE